MGMKQIFGIGEHRITVNQIARRLDIVIIEG